MIGTAPGWALAGALKRVTISKFPLKTDTGLEENAYFSNCGFGNVTCSASIGSFGQVSFNGIRNSSAGVLLLT